MKNLPKERKQFIKQKITEISEMDKDSLIAFVQNLYLSKEDLEKEVFDILLRASDLSMAYLQDMVSPMAKLDLEMDDNNMMEVEA